jgi:hypothetical protein
LYSSSDYSSTYAGLQLLFFLNMRTSSPKRKTEDVQTTMSSQSVKVRGVTLNILPPNWTMSS